MADPKCIICNKSPAMDCATCKSAMYCSNACQEIDEPVHEFLCKKFTKLSPRPSSTYKLGILLSADNPNPKTIWVQCPRVGPGDSSTRFSEPAINDFLGFPETNAYEAFVSTKNEVRGYDLDHKVVLYGRDNWLNDFSKPNQAALVLTDWELPYDWRGNLLIMSYTLVEMSRKPVDNFHDVTLGDLRTAVDYLSRYGMEIEVKKAKEHESLEDLRKTAEFFGLMDMFEKNQSENEKKKVKGVLLRCKADTKLYKQETGRT